MRVSSLSIIYLGGHGTDNKKNRIFSYYLLIMYDRAGATHPRKYQTVHWHATTSRHPIVAHESLLCKLVQKQRSRRLNEGEFGSPLRSNHSYTSMCEDAIILIDYQLST